jgi:hypothetical protein
MSARRTHNHDSLPRKHGAVLELGLGALAHDLRVRTDGRPPWEWVAACEPDVADVPGCSSTVASLGSSRPSARARTRSRPTSKADSPRTARHSRRSAGCANAAAAATTDALTIPALRPQRRSSAPKRDSGAPSATSASSRPSVATSPTRTWPNRGRGVVGLVGRPSCRSHRTALLSPDASSAWGYRRGNLGGSRRCRGKPTATVIIGTVNLAVYTTQSEPRGSPVVRQHAGRDVCSV